MVPAPKFNSGDRVRVYGRRMMVIRLVNSIWPFKYILAPITRENLLDGRFRGGRSKNSTYAENVITKDRN